MKIIVNFSGGRTSGRFCKHMKEKYGDDVAFVYMDTGTEHPATYDFIKRVNTEFELNLVCIRVEINPTLGEGNSYEILDVNDLCYDETVWEEMLAKYGTPYSPGGAFCTDRMKSTPYKKYCNDTYGAGNYITWIGIRADEPKRLFGKGYNMLISQCGYTQEEKVDLYLELIDQDLDEIKSSLEFNILDSVKLQYPKYMYHVENAANKIHKAHKMNFRYMAEELEDEKSDVMAFWRNQSFDLQLDEHLGNCVFCIKKTVGKIALASRDEPALADSFQKLITNDSVRITDRLEHSDIMYDGGNTFEGIIAMFSNVEHQELKDRFKAHNPNETSGGCSESCEMFGSDE